MTQQPSNVALALHGGAGAIPKDLITPERERDCHAALKAALLAGHRLLTKGASSLDAVIAAVVYLEDCPLFNAGCGAVLNYNGQVRTDAAVMEGQDQRAGAAANVTGVRNPVLLARAVMDSPHVLISGAGAVEFAQTSGLKFEDPAYFITPERQQEWLDAISNVAATSTPPGLGRATSQAPRQLAACCSNAGTASVTHQ
jgi:L-asparaginase / beta-aspartyl-peptidase